VFEGGGEGGWVFAYDVSVWASVVLELFEGLGEVWESVSEVISD
jgi:hypothetical protein